jgi:hypothetical protein
MILTYIQKIRKPLDNKYLYRNWYNKSMRLVLDGLNCQPSPGMVNRRNALFAADQATNRRSRLLYDCRSFRKTYLGLNASQGSNAL